MKSSGAGGRKKKEEVSFLSQLEATKEAGGLKAIRTAVEQIDAAQATLEPLGGIDGARAMLTTLDLVGEVNK